MLLPKLAPIRDKKWLDFQKEEMACLFTNVRSHDYETVDPCHVGSLGTGIKRGDDETLPIMHRFHKLGHDKGEWTMWRNNIPDAVLREALRAYARELYRAWKVSQ